MLVTAWLLTATLMRIHQTNVDVGARSGRDHRQDVPAGAAARGSVVPVFPAPAGAVLGSHAGPRRGDDRVVGRNVAGRRVRPEHLRRARLSREVRRRAAAARATALLARAGAARFRRPHLAAAAHAVRAAATGRDQWTDLRDTTDARAASATLDIRAGRRNALARTTRDADLRLAAVVRRGTSDLDADLLRLESATELHGERAAAQPHAQDRPGAARWTQRALDALAREMRERARQRRGVHCSGARQVSRRRIFLHARAAAPRTGLGRRLPVQHAPRLLRALCVGVHGAGARRRHSGARRHRLPGRRDTTR